MMYAWRNLIRRRTQISRPSLKTLRERERRRTELVWSLNVDSVAPRIVEEGIEAVKSIENATWLLLLHENKPKLYIDVFECGFQG